MADPFISPTLVPAGVNDRRSRDFTAAFGRLLGEFNTSGLLVQNAMTVDARLLPAMTVERAMTDFVVPGLMEHHLRALLERAPEIHAWTGTIHGTRRALGALGVTVDWTQWWQMQPPGPHDTHRVIAYVNEHLIHGETSLLSAATQYAVKRVIEATQRWSQDIAFLIGLRLRDEIGVASAIRSTVRLAPTMDTVSAMPGASAAVVPSIARIALLRPTMDSASAHPEGTAALAASCSVIQFVTRSMEAA